MRIIIFVLGACALMALPLNANYMLNSDVKDGLSDWRGDGDSVFLKPDGTEGAETDPGAIPVLKLPLSHSESHVIYQEVDTPNNPPHLRVSVEVYASADFQRSTSPDDYNVDWKAGITNYFGGIAVPNVDFWIRGTPGNFYKLSNLRPKSWVTVTGDFQNDPSGQQVVYFCVPPGSGAIYLKNPSANP
jgi:hypothetical protein